MAGRIVQIISIVCPCNKNRLLKLLKNNIIIKYETKMVIIIKINIVWSWKKFNCSINGEFLSCKPKLDHVAIVLIKVITLYMKLKFIALFCHTRNNLIY